MPVKRMNILPYATNETFSASHLSTGQFGQIWEPGRCHHRTIVTKFYGNEFCAVWVPPGSSDKPFYTEWDRAFCMSVRPLSTSEIFMASTAEVTQKTDIVMAEMGHGQIGEVTSGSYRGAIVVRTYGHIVCLGGTGATPWRSVWSTLGGNTNPVRLWGKKKKVRLIMG